MAEPEPVAPDAARLRQVYGCFPSGVTAVCALEGSEPDGIAASSFTSISVDPTHWVSICAQNTSSTWPRPRRVRRPGLSVLAQQQNQPCRTPALKTGDRFARVAWAAGADGALFVRDAVARLDCSVHRGNAPLVTTSSPCWRSTRCAQGPTGLRWRSTAAVSASSSGSEPKGPAVRAVQSLA